MLYFILSKEERNMNEGSENNYGCLSSIMWIALFAFLLCLGLLRSDGGEHNTTGAQFQLRDYDYHRQFN